MYDFQKACKLQNITGLNMRSLWFQLASDDKQYDKEREIVFRKDFQEYQFLIEEMINCCTYRPAST